MSRFTACIIGFVIGWFAGGLAIDLLRADASDRDGAWPMARMGYIRQHPACEACGVTSFDVGLSVHHIKPVEDGGSNDAANLITLCDPHEKGQDRESGCHLVLGHRRDFKTSNPHVRQDAAYWLRKIQKGKP